MDFQTIINNTGMWIASSFMVIAILVQSAIFLKIALKEASNLGIARERTNRAIRSAFITSIGPSVAPVIVLLALIPVLGAPTTWMRMCDIGAPSTELAMSALASQVAGVDIRSTAFGIKAFSYSLWGMALNNLGWLLFVLLFNNRMNQAIILMNKNTSEIMAKHVMTGALFGLMSYLLVSQVYVKNIIRLDYVIVAIVSGIAMFLISLIGKRYPIINEPALGLAMVVGLIATIFFK
jgi:hypothetical protein